MNKVVRALMLMSGGLDSILAAKILLEQNIEVHAITFVTPFFDDKKGRKAAKMLGIPSITIDFTDQYMEMMKAPRYGFGAHMNPCIDCHSLMIKETGKIMEREDYDLIATGEVLGERPMSQNRQSLENVAKNSGYADFLLRPLSALLMEPTIPEKKGLVDRNKLFKISGRSRKIQLHLAKEFEIKDFPQPAGGCLLTDAIYSMRLRELLSKNSKTDKYQLKLLALGRHFRLESGQKVIVGRNEKENNELLKGIQDDDTFLITDPLPGPLCLVPGGAEDNYIELAASLCVHYSKFRGQDIPITVIKGKEKRIIHPKIINENLLQNFAI